MLQLIAKNNPKKPTTKQLKEIKCLLTGEEDTTEETTGVDGLEPEDLNLLFAADNAESTDAATTG